MKTTDNEAQAPLKFQDKDVEIKFLIILNTKCLRVQIQQKRHVKLYYNLLL